jgi:hypothetical protein
MGGQVWILLIEWKLVLPQQIQSLTLQLKKRIHITTGSPLNYKIINNIINVTFYSLWDFINCVCTDCVQEITVKFMSFCTAGKHKEVETWSRLPSGKSECSSKEELKRWGEKKVTSPGNECKDKERSTSGRRTKSRSRSPVQHHRRTPSSTVATTPGTVQVCQHVNLVLLLIFSIQEQSFHIIKT